MPYAHTAFFTNEPAERLAAKLVSLAPAGFGSGRVAFVGSGSEAMEVALKLARQHFVERGEPAALALHRAPHELSRQHAGRAGGRRSHAAARDVRADADGRRATSRPASPTASSATTRPTSPMAAGLPTSWRPRSSTPARSASRRSSPSRSSARRSGCVPAVQGYFARIREICDRYGVLFIADEVMCGMGRTGDMFAIAHDGVCPDIITLGKGLGAGYLPIGATMASERVVRALEDGSGALANGHTYMSHAVACAGSLAVLECMERDRLLDNVRAQGTRLRAALDAALRRPPARRRHPRPRPVPRARAGRGSRPQASLRARAQDRRVDQGRGAAPRPRLLSVERDRRRRARRPRAARAAVHRHRRPGDGDRRQARPCACATSLRRARCASPVQ